jgi:formylglycine-generating enzyme required for sulfatase activity
MHGNMWEWCRDSYAEKLPGGRDPDVTNRSSYQVIRGGGWDYGASLCRSAFRVGNMPSAQFGAYGFRVALSPGQPVKPRARIPGDTSGRNSGDTTGRN